MTLNCKDLSTINRALGMVLGISDFGSPGASTLVDAVEMIDATLDEAEKRRSNGCEWCETFKGVLKSEDGHYVNAAFCPRCGARLEVR